MKRNSSIFVGLNSVIIALTVIAVGLPGLAYCQTEDPVLLLQQSPPEGGKITPAQGVHHFEQYEDVTLTAVPKPGYQFVYWLGDVSDPAANSTIVHLDAPKIVIAVFEQAEYKFLVVEEGPQVGAPGGGLFFSAEDYSRIGYPGGGGVAPTRRRGPSPPEEPADFPVPEQGEGDELPVPIPEPATVVLLVLGSLLAFARRGTKKQV